MDDKTGTTLIDSKKTRTLAADPANDHAHADPLVAGDAPFRALDMRDAGPALEDLRLERDRIALLIQRDGFPATVQWAWRTLRIYRSAVLDRTGFARLPLYRRRFIQSYCDFKRWLGRVPAHEHVTGRTQ